MLSYLRLQKLATCLSLKKEMFNSTKSRSSYPKTCKTRKSLFLNQFIKKIPKQSFRGVMQKFIKLTKETPEIESFSKHTFKVWTITSAIYLPLSVKFFEAIYIKVLVFLKKYSEQYHISKTLGRKRFFQLANLSEKYRMLNNS